jgi:peroxiredoxin
VAQSYGSYNDRSGYNIRTVYVVGKDGRIAYIDDAYAPGSEDSFKHLSDALNSLH